MSEKPTMGAGRAAGDRPALRTIVLAYSGGLDTSIIIPYLKEKWPAAEVVCVCVDVGQEEDWQRIRQRAGESGAKRLYIVDAKEQFAGGFLYPMVRAGALYEESYLLGTAIARPLQAAHQVRIARAEQADALAHGCTGKGNDQVRFELTYRALAPELAIIAPWRSWHIRSREEAIDYARAHNISLGDIGTRNIYSRDANVWHISHEGGDLENLANRPTADLYRMTRSPHEAPDSESRLTLTFEHGLAVALNDKALSPLEMVRALNRYAAENGIGRIDLVETRIIGMKSRGIYETPGGTVLFRALRALEQICLDHETMDIKRSLARRYADLVYGGKWYSAARNSIEAYMQAVARPLTGTIGLALYKGTIEVTSRHSEYSLYDEHIASFGESLYDHADAEGFVRLAGLPLEIAARVDPPPAPDDAAAFSQERIEYSE